MHLVEWFLLRAPQLLVTILVVAVLVAAMHLGSVAERRARRRSGNPATGTSDEGYIVSGAFGLMALLLGFTFSLAIDRYDHRRALTLEEANAIGTSYLRAQMLEEPSRSRLSALLQDYAANRLALARAEDPATQNGLMAATDRAQIQLWRGTIEAVRPVENSTISRPLIESMNATIDAGAARVAARRAHVPPRVMGTLLLYMMISAFILGFVGTRSGWKPAPTVLLALFALAYQLIIDIDRPTGGSIREQQAPIEDVLAMMRTNAPASFRSAPALR
ncbi:bestrophin-like domain [Sphingomonas sp. CCH5-D11]|uniref:bestrophin-like domain n=1 Tax=Sphingomonas sp. CCH5-D11 TaxID=1768786 RepID=UPI00082995FC|nr:hypothetical protein [Sphingomonas sp. CCH5-D11]